MAFLSHPDDRSVEIPLTRPAVLGYRGGVRRLSISLLCLSGLLAGLAAPVQAEKPEWKLEVGERIPEVTPGEQTWQDRFDDINAFERHLTRNGTKVIKFFLHLSKDEQKRRFLDRINEPDKHWKFSAADLAERQHWDAYMAAYEAMLSTTSTEHAPWYVIPADHKWVSRAAVATILAGTIKQLGLTWPTVTEVQEQQIEEARKSLEAEGAANGP